MITVGNTMHREIVIKKVNESADLPLVECIEWISKALKFEGDCNFEYAVDENWEFLIFSAKDYIITTKALLIVERSTRMILIQIKSTDGIAEFYFGRPLEKQRLLV